MTETLPARTEPRTYEGTYWTIATSDSSPQWIAHNQYHFVTAVYARLFVRRHRKHGDWRVYRVDAHYAITEDTGVTP